MLARLILPAALAAICAAQPAPQFDAISIKPIQPRETIGKAPQRMLPGGRLEANTSLRGLLMYAYDLRDYQISGLPAWAGSDPYNIVATSAPGANPGVDEVKNMLKSLLASRFGLSAQLQKKQMNVYSLEVARGGPKMTRSADGAPTAFQVGIGSLDAARISMDRLANSLAASLHQPVLDRTGLDGAYEIHLRAAEVGMVPRDPAQADAAAPSIFTALPEQLGLTLRASKEMIEVLQIERVEKPRAN